MNTSGTTLSTAISTEQAVREAYRQSSPRHRFIFLWKEASALHRCLIGVGMLGAATVVLLMTTQMINGFIAGLLLGGTAAIAAIGVVGTERRMFAEHFSAYGAMLRNQNGEPSKLRYLCFIDLLRDHERIEATHLERLIPTIQSQIEYRGHFFRRFPVLAILAALIVMLITSGLAQPRDLVNCNGSSNADCA